MAATIFGFTSNEIKPQPGFSARQSENGGWTARHEFYIKVSSFSSVQSSFANGVLLSSLDPAIPEPFDDFLRVSDVEITRVEGDFYVLAVTATGSSTGQFDGGEIGANALPTYLLAGGLTDAPFAQHPKFKALTLTERLYLGMQMQGDTLYNDDRQSFGNWRDDTNEWIPLSAQTLSEDCIEFAKLINSGESTYRKPVLTWTETTEGKDPLANDQINKLGKISSPRGSPPEPSGIRNWMLSNASQDQQGELYRTTLEWELSEEEGHNTFLYE